MRLGRNRSGGLYKFERRYPLGGISLRLVLVTVMVIAGLIALVLLDVV